MRACPSCTQPLPADATTCPSCGAATSAGIPFTAGNVDPWGAAPAAAAPTVSSGAVPPPLPIGPPLASSGQGSRGGFPTWAKVLLAVVAVFIVVGGAGAFFLVRAVRSIDPETIGGLTVTPDSGFTTFDGEALQVAGLDGLQIGDCVTTEGVPAPCSAPHEYEVFHIVPLPGSDYPGFDEVFDASSGVCTDVFEQYVGIDYFESEFFLDAFPSSEEAWQAGDHVIRCVAYDPFDEITGSIRGVAS